MRRGDLVTIALSGDYGKPRPALVVQADAFDGLPSVTVLRVTSELQDWPLFRIIVEANQETGLQQRSQVMVDKAATMPRSRIGQRIGRLDTVTMQAVSTALARFLGLD
ncbi:MAG TPA: type II toxin-antitoxin system PemK/MazF family toxin [Stellaceae bacterium]|nr:type II toxin-antitoxin system PemK/MazF family toxin [Stellaceae bacterium]